MSATLGWGPSTHLPVDSQCAQPGLVPRTGSHRRGHAVTDPTVERGCRLRGRGWPELMWEWGLSWDAHCPESRWLNHRKYSELVAEGPLLKGQWGQGCLHSLTCKGHQKRGTLFDTGKPSPNPAKKLLSLRRVEFPHVPGRPAGPPCVNGAQPASHSAAPPPWALP